MIVILYDMIPSCGVTRERGDEMVDITICNAFTCLVALITNK